MYTPSQFSVAEEDAVAFLAGIEAADLVTATAAGLLSTFLPLLFVPQTGAPGSLCGHLARKNEQWRQAPIGEALVIVHGHDAYIHPGWYASKAEHGQVVPTWNYTIAHVYGNLVVHDDADWVDRNVRALTARQERDRARPWSVDDAPEPFHAGQLRAIVGIELAITRIEAKFKLSQNQRADNIDGVIAGLIGDGRGEMAELVERLRPDGAGSPG